MNDRAPRCFGTRPGGGRNCHHRRKFGCNQRFAAQGERVLIERSGMMNQQPRRFGDIQRRTPTQTDHAVAFRVEIGNAGVLNHLLARFGGDAVEQGWQVAPAALFQHQIDESRGAHPWVGDNQWTTDSQTFQFLGQTTASSVAEPNSVGKAEEGRRLDATGANRVGRGVQH